MKLGYYLRKDLIFFRLPTTNKEKAIQYLIGKLCKIRLKGLAVGELCLSVNAREKISSTGLGRGLAIPHIRIETIDKLYVVFARSKKGIPWGAIDGKKVHYIFLIIGPSRLEKEYLILLSQISRVVMRTDMKKILRTSHSPEEVIAEVRRSQIRHNKR